MKNLASSLVAASLLTGASLSANATTLDITATADNQFAVYLATAAQFAANQLGTQIGNNPAGTDWTQAYTLPPTVLAGAPLYLQVVLTNWTPTNGFPQYPYSATSNPSAFLGDLSLVGGSYAFANGGTSLSTDATDWSGSTTSSPSIWTATAPGVVSYGSNAGPSIWFSDRPGSVPGISLGADWIFYGDQSTALYSDLSTKIVFTGSGGSGGTTPLPASWTMMLIGMAGLGFAAFGRRKQTTAEFAA